MDRSTQNAWHGKRPGRGRPVLVWATVLALLVQPFLSGWPGLSQAFGETATAAVDDPILGRILLCAGDPASDGQGAPASGDYCGHCITGCDKLARGPNKPGPIGSGGTRDIGRAQIRDDAPIYPLAGSRHLTRAPPTLSV